MDTVALGIFLTAAVGLLGSPGPAIAALIAVGRARAGNDQPTPLLGLFGPGELAEFDAAAGASAGDSRLPRAADQ